MLAVIEGITLLPCAIVAKLDNYGAQSANLLVLAAIYLASGIFAFIFVRGYKIQLKLRDGYFIACASWLFCSLLGAVPFLISGMNYSIIGSLFESIAGFTTTGCSVFDINVMPRSLLLWRSILNWIGGMGILVLVTSVFPALGIGGQAIASSETTGPSLQKIGTKFSETGKFLYITYLTLSALEFVFLSFKLAPFDALINTFSSISTGGLFIRDIAQMPFQTTYIRLVVTIFTLLSSINYTLYFLIITGKWRVALKNYELKIFLIIVGCATIILTLALMFTNVYASPFIALRDAFFQVVSFISTSGYFIADYTAWPTFTLVLLFSLLFIGGCSMSTTGSLKVTRVVTVFKIAKRGVYKLIHPASVKAIIIDGKPLPAKKVSEITTHILLFFFILIIGCIALATSNLGIEETITTTLGIFTNTGLALGQAGIRGYFGDFNIFSQLFMCFLMIAGRLEMYSLLLMFTKSFWSIDSSNRV